MSETLNKGLCEEVRNIYNNFKCALCSSGSKRAEICPIIPFTAKGKGQMAWLQHTKLAPNLTHESAENYIPLCRYHAKIFRHGTIALCPPLEQLKKLLELGLNKQLPAGNELGSELALLWVSDPCYSNEMLPIGPLEYMPSSLTETEHSPPLPQKLTIERNTDRDNVMCMMNHPVKWNFPKAPAEASTDSDILLDFGGRVNPYACMVRAMDLLGTWYLDAEISWQDWSQNQAFPVKNLGPSYHAVLLKIRDAFSISIDQ